MSKRTFAPILLAGCSVDYKAEVESDTTWSGAFGSACREE